MVEDLTETSRGVAICRIFASFSNPKILREQYEFGKERIEFRPNYNVALTQQVVTITNDGTKMAEYITWGLVPLGHGPENRLPDDQRYSSNQHFELVANS